MLLLEFNGCQVLLVGALLVVERKEQGVEVEGVEVLCSRVHRDGWVQVVFLQIHGVFRVEHFFLSQSRHVSERGVQEFLHLDSFLAQLVQIILLWGEG